MWLLDVFCGRLEYPELKRAIIAQARHHRATLVLIEDKGSGNSLLQDLVRDRMRNVEGVMPVADKFMRMRMQTAAIENGFVYLPKNAPWLADYLHELMMFPKGKHDDQVDSTSQALQYLNWRPKEPSITTHYRLLSEHRNGGRNDNSLVTMKGTGATVYTAEGKAIMQDADGLYRMIWKDAKPLLNCIGWSLVEDGS